MYNISVLKVKEKALDVVNICMRKINNMDNKEFSKSLMRLFGEMSKYKELTNEDLEKLMQFIDSDNYVPTNEEKALNLVDEAYMHNKKKAISLCNEALEIDPNCIEAYNLIVNFESDPIKRIEKFKENLQKCERILQLEKVDIKDVGIGNAKAVQQFFVTKNTIAKEYIKISRYKEAITVLEELLFLTKGNDIVNARENLMMLYCMYEEKDNMDNLNKMYENEENFMFHLCYSIYYFKIGNYDEAKKELLSAKVIDKEFVKLVRNLEKYTLMLQNDEIDVDQSINIEDKIDKIYPLFLQVPYYESWARKNVR